MSLTLLSGLPPALAIHLTAALVALALGPFALWRKRRDRVHKVMGYVWVLVLGIAALSTFGIPSGFTKTWLGPIHLLSLYALYGLYDGMRAIYRGDLRRHQATMRALYIQGVLFTGSLTLLPGRLLQRVIFPEAEAFGYVVIAGVAAWAFVWPLVRRWTRVPA